MNDIGGDVSLIDVWKLSFPSCAGHVLKTDIFFFDNSRFPAESFAIIPLSYGRSVDWADRANPIFALYSPRTEAIEMESVHTRKKRMVFFAI